MTLYSIDQVLSILRDVHQSRHQVDWKPQRTCPRLIYTADHVDPIRPQTPDGVVGIAIQQDQQVIMLPTSLANLSRPDIAYFAPTRVATLSYPPLVVLDLLRKRFEEPADDLVRIGEVG
ncbi:hypothetical protein D9M69_721250 [compost metagenome]